MLLFTRCYSFRTAILHVLPFFLCYCSLCVVIPLALTLYLCCSYRVIACALLLSHDFSCTIPFMLFFSHCSSSVALSTLFFSCRSYRAAIHALFLAHYSSHIAPCTLQLPCYLSHVGPLELQLQLFFSHYNTSPIIVPHVLLFSTRVVFFVLLLLLFLLRYCFVLLG